MRFVISKNTRRHVKCTVERQFVSSSVIKEFCGENINLSTL